MQNVDDLDLKLLSELKKDGNISVPVLSKKLEINASVLYSRIKRLIRKKLIKKFTIEIDGFGYASASDFGSEVFLGSLAGFYHVFSDSDSLRSFALGLMDAATQIESSRIVIETTAVPEGYAETVLADWSDQIVADAWLYPGKENDDSK